MSLSKVIEIARGELGYTESPAGSNRTKYGQAYSWDGVPWCCIFLWWCFREAGEDEAFYGGGKTASCGALYRWYLERGMTVPPEDAKPGDILILDFSGKGETQHCGLVEDCVPGVWWRTIEGNTSPGLEGSQSAGGSVAAKVRFMRNVVGVCRPAYREIMMKDIDLKDCKDHWAEKALQKAIKKGVLKGYDDGWYHPDLGVSRAELATILDRLGLLDK